MDVMKTLETRRSIRKYLPKPIEKEKLAKIAEAFRLAPSARNGQSWKLLIVTDPAVKKKIQEASPSKAEWITGADAVLVGICSTQNVMTNGHRVDTTDVSIAMTCAMLEAHELGLGTCWMAYYTEPEMRTALGLGEDMSVVAIMPTGYADESPEFRGRKDASEIIEYI